MIIQPRVFEDKRGYFFESFNKKTFADAGLNIDFIQDNQSLSGAGILRGLHFQAPPFAQAKLVRVIKGAVVDVAVDIRKDSPTYGEYFSIELNEDNKTQLLVPAGFAHGFVTLVDNTIFSYKCTNLYNKESEGGILWNDRDLGIEWNIAGPVISEKDEVLPCFKDFVSPF
ncbi:MAG: dTDP-4-dehydrorhamnose 3,5-epimerase [Sphingobacteriales bacterium]|jgi:dTDP-4-dehydrorhamnose 3,5-epimerase